MGFPIGDQFSVWYFLLADGQTCQLFENDQMATRKRSKETNSDFIARIWSAEHFKFKRYSFERWVIWTNTIFNRKQNEIGEQNIQF